MFRPKELPDITKDIVINNDIYVVAGILYLNNTEHQFKYEKGDWYIKVDDGSFVKIGHGAIPNFNLKERIDATGFDDFFEEETIKEEPNV